MAIQDTINQIIIIYQQSGNSSPEGIAKLRAELQQMNEEQLNQKLSQMLSNSNLQTSTDNFEKTDNEIQEQILTGDVQTTTDENGDIIQEYKNGEELLARTITHVNEDGTFTEVIVAYSNGKPTQKIKKENGNVSEVATFETVTDESGEENIVINSTRKGSRTNSKTQVKSVDKNGDYTDDDFISRDTESTLTGERSFVKKEENGYIYETKYNSDNERVSTIKYESSKISEFDKGNVPALKEITYGGYIESDRTDGFYTDSEFTGDKIREQLSNIQAYMYALNNGGKAGLNYNPTDLKAYFQSLSEEDKEDITVRDHTKYLTKGNGAVRYADKAEKSYRLNRSTENGYTSSYVFDENGNFEYELIESDNNPNFTQQIYPDKTRKIIEYEGSKPISCQIIDSYGTLIGTISYNYDDNGTLESTATIYSDAYNNEKNPDRKSKMIVNTADGNVIKYSKDKTGEYSIVEEMSIADSVPILNNKNQVVGYMPIGKTIVGTNGYVQRSQAYSLDGVVESLNAGEHCDFSEMDTELLTIASNALITEYEMAVEFLTKSKKDKNWADGSTWLDEILKLCNSGVNKEALIKEMEQKRDEAKTLLNYANGKKPVQEFIKAFEAVSGKKYSEEEREKYFIVSQDLNETNINLKKIFEDFYKNGYPSENSQAKTQFALINGGWDESAYNDFILEMYDSMGDSNDVKDANPFATNFGGQIYYNLTHNSLKNVNAYHGIEAEKKLAELIDSGGNILDIASMVLEFGAIAKFVQWSAKGIKALNLMNKARKTMPFIEAAAEYASGSSKTAKNIRYALKTAERANLGGINFGLYDTLHTNISAWSKGELATFHDGLHSYVKGYALGALAGTLSGTVSELMIKNFYKKGGKGLLEDLEKDVSEEIEKMAQKAAKKGKNLSAEEIFAKEQAIRSMPKWSQAPILRAKLFATEVGTFTLASSTVNLVDKVELKEALKENLHYTDEELKDISMFDIMKGMLTLYGKNPEGMSTIATVWNYAINEYKNQFVGLGQMKLVESVIGMYMSKGLKIPESGRRIQELKFESDGKGGWYRANDPKKTNLSTEAMRYYSNQAHTFDYIEQTLNTRFDELKKGAITGKDFANMVGFAKAEEASSNSPHLADEMSINKKDGKYEITMPNGEKLSANTVEELSNVYYLIKTVEANMGENGDCKIEIENNKYKVDIDGFVQVAETIEEAYNLCVASMMAAELSKENNIPKVMTLAMAFASLNEIAEEKNRAKEGVNESVKPESMEVKDKGEPSVIENPKVQTFMNIKPERPELKSNKREVSREEFEEKLDEIDNQGFGRKTDKDRYRKAFAKNPELTNALLDHNLSIAHIEQLVDLTEKDPDFASQIMPGLTGSETSRITASNLLNIYEINPELAKKVMNSKLSSDEPKFSKDEQLFAFTTDYIKDICKISETSAKKLEEIIDSLEKENSQITIAPERNSNSKIEKYCITCGNKKFYMDMRGEVLALDENSRGHRSETITDSEGRTIDYKENVEEKTLFGEKFLKLINSTKTVKDKDGNILYTEYCKESGAVQGKYDVIREFPGGRKVHSGIAEITPSGDIKVEYSFENGTSQFNKSYTETPNGSRSSRISVTNNTTGKTFEYSYEFEKVDNNHFVSIENGQEYNIEYKEDKVVVTRGDGEKVEVSIGGNELFEEGVLSKDLLPLLKKMPGSAYFEIVEKGLKKIRRSSENESKEDANYIREDKCINIIREIAELEDSFTLMHEFGHYTDVSNDITWLTGNKEYRQTLDKERENFENNSSVAESEVMEHIIKGKNPYEEFMAEVKAILTETSKLEDISLRAQYLIQNFPESFAKAAELLLGERVTTKDRAEAKREAKPANSNVKNPLESPEFKVIKDELVDLYKKKKLNDKEQIRVIELEAEVQKYGVLVARSPIVELTKISMLAKSDPREAFLPDFNNEEQLKSVGFTKKEDGKWYHWNKDWYPDALSEKDVVYVFQRDENGVPIDTGFGPKDELKTLYVRAEDFDNNNMIFIDPSELTPGQPLAVKKCASGSFCIFPPGTKLFTSEGIVEVKTGEIVNIKEDKNSLHTSDFENVPKYYKADPLNPASKKLFDLIKEYNERQATMTTAERTELQDKISDTFNRVNRGQKLYEFAPEFADRPPETLREEYDLASKIAEKLEEKYLSKIDVSDFNTALEQARDILTKIYSDKTLNSEQKNAAVTAVMVKLLPKTNAHQHTKGSLPKETALLLAAQKGYTPEQIEDLENAYIAGEKGFDTLTDFNKAYGTIGRVVRTASDYKIAIDSIIRKAVSEGQLTTEIRCACDSLMAEDGKTPLSPEEGTKVILDAIEETKAALRKEGKSVPAMGFVFLTYRGKDWDESLPAAKIQAEQAVKSAQEHPDMKFGFDIAGPEDSGWGPKAFEESIAVIKDYNIKVEHGEIQGQTIGITMHAGETPTFDGGRDGWESVQEAIEMGSNRIGHGVQAALDEDTMQLMKDSGITVEICGVCNILSIPINTKGLAIHPIQQFIDKGIKVSLCTDNDALCGSNITKEYNQFLLTGHSSFMDWNAVKQSARDGVEAAFIPETEKSKVRQELEVRIAKIQKLLNEVRTDVGIDPAEGAISKSLFKMETPKDVVTKAQEVLAKKPYRIATAGYTDVPEGYESSTKDFLRALESEIGDEQTAYVTSPTTKEGSIDAITAEVEGLGDGSVFFVTAEKYLKYIDPEILPSNMDIKEFSETPKYVLPDKASYQEAITSASNVFIALGGRKTTLADFINAIKKGNKAIIVDNTSLKTTSWDSSKGEIDNASRYIEEQIKAVKEGKPLPHPEVGEFTREFIEKNMDKLDKLYRSFKTDGSTESSKAAARKAAEFIRSGGETSSVTQDKPTEQTSHEGQSQEEKDVLNKLCNDFNIPVSTALSITTRFGYKNNEMFEVLKVLCSIRLTPGKNMTLAEKENFESEVSIDTAIGLSSRVKTTEDAQTLKFLLENNASLGFMKTLTPQNYKYSNNVDLKLMSEYIKIIGNNKNLIENINIPYINSHKRHLNIIREIVEKNPNITESQLRTEIENKIDADKHVSHTLSVNNKTQHFKNDTLRDIARALKGDYLEELDELDLKYENVYDTKLQNYIEGKLKECQELISQGSPDLSELGEILAKIDKYLDMYHTLNGTYEMDAEGKERYYYREQFIKINPDAESVMKKSENGEVVNHSIFKDYANEPTIEILRDYLEYNANDEMASHFYREYYLGRANIPEEIKDICIKLDNEYGSKIFLTSDLSMAKEYLDFTNQEFSQWKQKSNGEAKFPQVLDFSKIKIDYIDKTAAYGQGVAGGFARPITSKFIGINGMDSMYYFQTLIRHEMTHINDTKQGNNYEQFEDIMPHKTNEEGYSVPDFENCKYREEFLKAGIPPENIPYAYNNTKEFIAVASEGNMSSYSEKFKALLVDMGMPKWQLDLETLSYETTYNAVLMDRIVDYMKERNIPGSNDFDSLMLARNIYLQAEDLASQVSKELRRHNVPNDPMAIFDAVMKNGDLTILNSDMETLRKILERNYSNEPPQITHIENENTKDLPPLELGPDTESKQSRSVVENQETTTFINTRSEDNSDVKTNDEVMYSPKRESRKWSTEVKNVVDILAENMPDDIKSPEFESMMDALVETDKKNKTDYVADGSIEDTLWSLLSIQDNAGKNLKTIFSIIGSQAKLGTSINDICKFIDNIGDKKPEEIENIVQLAPIMSKLGQTIPISNPEFLSIANLLSHHCEDVQTQLINNKFVLELYNSFGTVLSDAAIRTMIDNYNIKLSFGEHNSIVAYKEDHRSIIGNEDSMEGKILSQFLDKQSTAEPLLLYRGEDYGFANTIKIGEKTLGELLIEKENATDDEVAELSTQLSGFSFQQPHFMSTSMSKDVASQPIHGSKIVWNIELEKGSKAVCIDVLAPDSKHSAEAEILLQNGANIEIRNITRKYGVYNINVKVNTKPEKKSFTQTDIQEMKAMGERVTVKEDGTVLKFDPITKKTVEIGKMETENTVSDKKSDNSVADKSATPGSEKPTEKFKAKDPIVEDHANSLAEKYGKDVVTEYFAYKNIDLNSEYCDQYCLMNPSNVLYLCKMVYGDVKIEDVKFVDECYGRMTKHLFYNSSKSFIPEILKEVKPEERESLIKWLDFCNEKADVAEEPNWSDYSNNDQKDYVKNMKVFITNDQFRANPDGYIKLIKEIEKTDENPYTIQSHINGILNISEIKPEQVEDFIEVVKNMRQLTSERNEEGEPARFYHVDARLFAGLNPKEFNQAFEKLKTVNSKLKLDFETLCSNASTISQLPSEYIAKVEAALDGMTDKNTKMKRKIVDKMLTTDPNDVEQFNHLNKWLHIVNENLVTDLSVMSFTKAILDKIIFDEEPYGFEGDPVIESIIPLYEKLMTNKEILDALDNNEFFIDDFITKYIPLSEDEVKVENIDSDVVDLFVNQMEQEKRKFASEILKEIPADFIIEGLLAGRYNAKLNFYTFEVLATSTKAELEEYFNKVDAMKTKIGKNPDLYLNGEETDPQIIKAIVDNFCLENNQNLFKLFKTFDKEAIELLMRKRLDDFGDYLDDLSSFDSDTLDLLKQLAESRNIDGKPFMPTQKIEFIDLITGYINIGLSTDKMWEMVKSGKVNLGELNMDLFKTLMKHSGLTDEEIESIPKEKLTAWDIKYTHFLVRSIGDGEAFIPYLNATVTNETFNAFADIIRAGNFEPNFIEYLHNVENKYGKANAITRTIFRELGIDYDKWINPSKENEIHFLFKDKNAEQLFQITEQITEDLNSLMQTPVKGFLKKQMPKFIKGDEFVIPNEYLTSKSKLAELLNMLTDTSDKGILSQVWKRAQGNAANSDPERASKARNTLTILNHLNQRSKDISNISDVKISKTLDLTIKMWDRIPQKDLFQGNYSTCCIGMGEANSSAMPHYIMNTAFNMIEIIDNQTGKTIGNALCYFVKGADGKPALIIDNIEIRNSVKPSSDAGIQLRNSITEYATRVAKEVIGSNDINIYMSSNYNDVPCEDLKSKKETITFLGEFDCNDIYMDLYDGWTDKDELTSEQTLLILK